jgi:hypothetical protein
MSSPFPKPSPELPKTLEAATEQAKVATQAALEAGYTRLQVELQFPELKILPVAQQFVPAFEAWGSQLRVYFPDAGAAALARRDWGEQPYPIRGIRDLKAELEPKDRLILFVEPSAVEVQAVEQICQMALDRPVVMLNPRLEDVAIVGIGLAARQLRERFLSTFEPCYYLQPLEKAAIFRAFPFGWQVWVEDAEGDYSLLAETPQKPVGEELEQILSTNSADAAVPSRRKGLLASMQQFLRALSQ